MTESSPGKRTPLSGVVPPATVTRRVAPATVELETHLMLPPTWRASYRGVKTEASMLFESVSEYRSLVARVDSGTQESRRETQRFILVQANLVPTSSS